MRASTDILLDPSSLVVTILHDAGFTKITADITVSGIALECFSLSLEI